MGKIDDACREVIEKLDGAIACGVVEVETGAVLGIHCATEPVDALDGMVSATAELLKGPHIGRIEEIAGGQQKEGDTGYFQEVHITSEHNCQFARTIKDGKAIVVLVTAKTTNIGMGWAHLKSIIPAIETLIL